MNRAHIADIEPGALSIEEGAAKMKGWVAEGRQYVTGYVNRSERPQLEPLVAGIKHSLWVATLDGNMNVDDQYTAMVQFAPEGQFGLHVDASIVYHEWWLPLGRMISTAAAEQIVSDVAGLSNAVAQVTRAIGVL